MYASYERGEYGSVSAPPLDDAIAFRPAQGLHMVTSRKSLVRLGSKPFLGNTPFVSNA
jgi:hypothetical protein